MPHAKFHCPELNWDVLNIYIHCLTTKSFFSLVFEGINCLQLFRRYRMYFFYQKFCSLRAIIIENSYYIHCFFFFSIIDSIKFSTTLLFMQLSIRDNYNDAFKIIRIRYIIYYNNCEVLMLFISYALNIYYLPVITQIKWR